MKHITNLPLSNRAYFSRPPPPCISMNLFARLLYLAILATWWDSCFPIASGPSDGCFALSTGKRGNVSTDGDVFHRHWRTNTGFTWLTLIHPDWDLLGKREDGCTTGNPLDPSQLKAIERRLAIVSEKVRSRAPWVRKKQRGDCDNPFDSLEYAKCVLIVFGQCRGCRICFALVSSSPIL